MALYQKLLTVVSALALGACAVKFDPVEHSRLVDVRWAIHQAIQDNHCADHTLARETARRVNQDATWLQFYSQHIPNNGSLQVMATELHKTTEDFARRYQKDAPPPSRVFCELRLKNIMTQIETIQSTNARRPR